MWMKNAETDEYFNTENGSRFIVTGADTDWGVVNLYPGVAAPQRVVSGYTSKAHAVAALDEFMSDMEVKTFPQPSTDEERGEVVEEQGNDRGPNVEKVP